MFLRRKRLVDWYTSAQLSEYRAIFCGSEEVGDAAALVVLAKALRHVA